MRKTKPSVKRPYVVAEFGNSFNYHGRLWTVGCKTEEAARRSFERRMAANSGAGAVIAYERATSHPICWSDDVLDPVQALDYFVGGASRYWTYDAESREIRPRGEGTVTASNILPPPGPDHIDRSPGTKEGESDPPANAVSEAVTAILSIHRDLLVCAACGWLTGPLGGRLEGYEQQCRCVAAPQDRWPQLDFNRAAELCYCCGQEILPSGSRFALWFCAPCNHEVQLLNARLGRYAIPLGRHSVHAGMLLDEKTLREDPAEFVLSAIQWGNISQAISALHDWSGTATRAVLAEHWTPTPERVPITEYLTHAPQTEEERARWFREMLAFLSTYREREGR